jgi:tetratricopeptide (TPR) repeat protein
MPSYFDTPYAALILDEEEEYEELIEKLTEHIRTSRSPGVAIHNRAVAMSEIGRVDEALSEFEHAAVALPGDCMPLKVKGALLLQLERLPEALESLDRAVLVAPREPTLLRTRAHAREKAGLLAAAIEDLEVAIAVEPDFQPTRRERTRLLAKLSERRG